MLLKFLKTEKTKWNDIGVALHVHVIILRNKFLLLPRYTLNTVELYLILSYPTQTYLKYLPLFSQAELDKAIDFLDPVDGDVPKGGNFKNSFRTSQHIGWKMQDFLPRLKKNS